MKYKLFIISISVAFLCQPIFSQNSNDKPEWALNPVHIDLKKSYIETIVATGISKEEVRKEVVKIVAQRRELTIGKRVLGENEGATAGFTVASNQLAEYWECSEFCTGYFLMQTCKNYQCDFEPVEIGTKVYHFSPRVFVPGMAQLYKGSTAKGVLFIAGEVVLVGGIVVAESLRASNVAKYNTTHNKQMYANNADMCENVRNGLIAGAVAFYLWNVIDGWVAKGKPHILIGENQLKITPYALPDAAGIYLSINF
jgi:hypothetical protein